MMSNSFMGFAERQERIEKVITILSNVPDPNDFNIQCQAYLAAGIDSDTFTQGEMDYICAEIERRHR